ncbi:hypothetical protein BD311DRAFT_756509 [Dichomitus squalens]|uniref:RING-type domain-containing protein n=1 Tax=Dichomitus squalens TaxID=114155 RepID=A0A4Q9MNQ1_9APHY|nr:hypothetical protein BD311DRAFT_756509 [Dichomitus squalens]
MQLHYSNVNLLSVIPEKTMAKRKTVGCWQCGKMFTNEDSCRMHGRSKGHEWSAPVSVQPATSGKPIASTSTVTISGTPASTEGLLSNRMTSKFIHCPACNQIFGSWDGVTTHYSIFHATHRSTQASMYPCSVCKEFVDDQKVHYQQSPKHPKCTACKLGFEDAIELQKHMAARITCDVCVAHLLPALTMEEHYQMSSVHPKCESCLKAFRGSDELVMHLRGCGLKTTPEPAADDTKLSRDTPEHLKCAACVNTFGNEEQLKQHMSLRTTCDVCNVHITFATTLEDHYQESRAHPKCTNCWYPFKGQDELQMHQQCCRIKMTSVSASSPFAPVTTMLSRTAPPVGVLDANRTLAMDSGDDELDGALWEAARTRTFASMKSEWPQLYPSLQRQTDPSGEANTPPQVEHNWDDHTSVSSRFSDTAGSSHIPMQDEAVQLSQTAATRGEQDPLNPGGPSASPTWTTQSLNGNRAQDELQPSRALPSSESALPSWHCRSCLRDPCSDPVATMCGHIFCQSCIIREFSARMACPVCEQVVFIKLDLRGN